MMGSQQPHSRGRTFEQFNIGDTIVTQPRTITEADIVTFAKLTGDNSAIHVDPTAAAASTHGQRIAHGLLVQSLASGLAIQTGMVEGTVIAFREMTCKFSQAAYIGDTIYVSLEVSAKKLNRRLNFGNITLRYNVLKQDDTIVQRGNWVMLVKL